MSILDQVLSGMASHASGGTSPIQGILGDLLGSKQSGGIAGMPDSGAGGAGGLQTLLSRFEGAGLGDVARSWIGSGPNKPVTPEQLGGVLGPDQVQSMSQKSGMAPHDLLSQLSQHLPDLIDKLTPNGQVPTATGSHM